MLYWIKARVLSSLEYQVLNVLESFKWEGMVWEIGGRKVGGKGALPLNNRSIISEVYDGYEQREEEWWEVWICLDICINHNLPLHIHTDPETGLAIELGNWIEKYIQ